MAEVQIIRWERTQRMTKEEIIRFQLVTHCHFQKIHISSADLDCLTLLGQQGEAELTAFCELLTLTTASVDQFKKKISKAKKKEKTTIFLSSQSSRNAISRLEDRGLIVKQGRNKKKISLHPDLKIQNTGNVFVDVKCFSPIKDLVNGTN